MKLPASSLSKTAVAISARSTALTLFVKIRLKYSSPANEVLPLLEALEKKTYDLSSLFIVGSGGAILSPHNKEAFLRHIPNGLVIDGFGASETGAQGSHATSGKDKAQTGKFAMSGALVLKQDLSAQLPPGTDETGWLARSGQYMD